MCVQRQYELDHLCDLQRKKLTAYLCIFILSVFFFILAVWCLVVPPILQIDIHVMLASILCQGVAQL